MPLVEGWLYKDNIKICLHYPQVMVSLKKQVSHAFVFTLT